MKELKAWRLTIDNKENGRRSCIYHVAETLEDAKEYFKNSWSRFQRLVRIEDISNSKKGLRLIESYVFLRG